MICSKCKKDLPDECFYIDGRYDPPRRRKRCKRCVSKKSKDEYRTKNVIHLICEECGTDFQVNINYGKNARFCSRKCFFRNKRSLDDDIIVPKREVVDGLVLGDLHITRDGRYSWNLKYREFANYTKTALASYSPKLKQYENVWSGRSLTHPTIKLERKRWYPDDIKIVPEDVSITPISVLIWYLGDGSIHKVRGHITISSQSFTYDDNVRLSEMLLKSSGTKSSIKLDSKKMPYIYIPRTYAECFFEYIGHKSPVECYDYKFVIPGRQLYRNYQKEAKRRRREKQILHNQDN